MDRATFRARTLGAQKVFRKTQVDLGDGLVVEVRQPSIKGRAAIVKASQTSPKAPPEIAELQVEAVIRCTFLEDGTQAFEPADRDSLMEQPSGGWFDKLAEAATKFLNVDEEDLKKNSSEAPSDDSSS